MYRFDNRIHFSDAHSSLFSAFLIFIVSMIGFQVIGPVVGMIAALPFIEGSLMNAMSSFIPPFTDPSIKVPLFIIQGFATGVGLIFVPFLFIKIREKMQFHELFKRPIPLGKTTLMVFLIGFSFMGFNAFFIEWNQGIEFPDILRGFEIWARESEERAAEATRFLTTFDNIGQFILAFVVIAILPSIGEELVFRGLIQNYIHKGTRNIHLGIWISAILFSAIHMQFYGFVPRMLLGALFGYLYYWSSNLWVPILAHFFNNGFTILMVYLNQHKIVEFDIENTESVPWHTILLFGAISFILIRYFYTFFKKYNIKHGQLEERVQDKRSD